jgi:hypothetical protein
VGCITAVKNTTDFSSDVTGSVHSEVFQIIGDPASVNKNCILLALCVQMGVEGSNDLYAAFASELLFNLELLLVIEDSFDRNWLK